MSEIEVGFHRLSAEEFRNARRRYERCRAGLGSDFTAEVARAVERIAAQPDRWPAFRGKYRRVRLRRFPYALYYHIADTEQIVVLAVAHDRRRPGYWVRRASKP